MASQNARTPTALLFLDAAEKSVSSGLFALFVLVRLDVFGKVVAPHEPLAALLAAEPLLSSVSPEVALKLIGPGEAFPAEEPVADEGPFTSVPAQVSLKVGCLFVDLAALWDVTDVKLLLAQLICAAPAA